MGLFDGAGASELSGSAAEIAAWLGAPVLLVVNSHGMARSIAPMVAGFAKFDETVRIGGVVANQCGSEKHGAILAEALAAAGLPPMAGAVPRGGVPELPSRHLGLVTAHGAANCTPDIIDAFAHAAEEHLDLAAVLAIARETPPLPGVVYSPVPEKRKEGPRVRLGVALDEAFHFYYRDLFDALEARGVAVEYFSPLRDETLPPEIDALYLGGGYPEAFARTLSENGGMLRSIREFSMTGRPLYAECGGLIYLSRAVTDRDGKRHPLLGIFPGETRMLQRRKRLGYVEAKLREETLWGPAGAVFRGHEFHYSELLPLKAVDLGGWSSVYDMNARGRERISPEGFYHAGRRILTSYVHLHLGSRPEALDHFIDTCIRSRKKF